MHNCLKLSFYCICSMQLDCFDCFDSFCTVICNYIACSPMTEQKLTIWLTGSIDWIYSANTIEFHLLQQNFLVVPDYLNFYWPLLNYMNVYNNRNGILALFLCNESKIHLFLLQNKSRRNSLIITKLLFSQLYFQICTFWYFEVRWRTIKDTNFYHVKWKIIGSWRIQWSSIIWTIRLNACMNCFSSDRFGRIEFYCTDKFKS